MRPAPRIHAALSLGLILLTLLAGAFTAAAPAPALAQVDPVTPKRLVQQYDFEDMNDQGVKLGRGLDLPPAWYPMGRPPQSRDPNFNRLPLHDQLSRRPGFPMHNLVRYSAMGDAATADYSLHLAIDGGSAGAFLQIGALPAVPGSDYLLTARVRTTNLQHAAARVRAYFIDAGGNRLEPSTRITPRLRTAGAWTDIELILTGDQREAAYIGLEVELVQPNSDPLHVLGNQQIILTDVKGDAWFDDVAIWQLPHVEINTGSRVNVTRSPAGPFWDVSVRDLVGGRLIAQVTVFDHNLDVVAQDRRSMGWGAPSQWRWSPQLPGYGWFLTELAVIEGAPIEGPRSRGGSDDGRSMTIGGMSETLSIDDTTTKTQDPAPGNQAPAPTLASASNADDAPAGQGPIALPDTPELAEETSEEAAQISGAAGEMTGGGGGGRVIARTYNAVLWLPPGGGAVGADAERFALVAEGMDDRQLALLPELAGVAGLGTVVFSAWDAETSLGALDLRLQKLQEVIASLKNAGRRVELSFSPVPEELAHTRGVNSPLAAKVFSAPLASWMPYVQPILVRQGQRVNTWQLGSADDAEAAYLPGLGQTVDAVYEEFRHWTPDPTLALPWRVDQPPHADVAGEHVGYTVQWPTGVTPERLVDHLEDAGGLGWSDPAGSRRLQIRPSPADVTPHAARIADLALRMVHAWEQDAIGVALPDLWARGLERQESLLPDPLLGVAANVAARLAGYRAIGRLNLGDDRAAVIFERQPLTEDEAHANPAAVAGQGMIVAWNIKAPDSRAKLEMFLGDNPIAHDVWGNTSTPTRNEKQQHVLPLTDTPVFVTGIDPKLALFRSSFAIDQPFVTSTQTPHLRTVSVSNPWPVTISGHFTITGPEEWTIKPFRHVFSLAPGRTLRVPIAMRFPVNEVAGGKSLSADFDFTVERQHQIQLATPMQLGLEGLRFESSLALEAGAAPGTVDAAVTCIITNTGQEPMSLNVFANLPGHARKDRLIPRLDPGQAVIRQIRFVDAAPALSQSDINFGVRETNGPAVLNQRVGIHDVE